MEISEVTQTHALGDLLTVLDKSQIQLLTEKKKIRSRDSIIDSLSHILRRDGSNFGEIDRSGKTIREIAYAVVQGKDGVDYHIISVDQPKDGRIYQTFNVFVFLEDGTNCYLCRVLEGDPQEAREKAYEYTQKFLDGKTKKNLPRQEGDDENLLSIERLQARPSGYIAILLQKLNQDGH